MNEPIAPCDMRPLTPTSSTASRAAAVPEVSHVSIRPFGTLAAVPAAGDKEHLGRSFCRGFDGRSLPPERRAFVDRAELIFQWRAAGRPRLAIRREHDGRFDSTSSCSPTRGSGSIRSNSRSVLIVQQLPGKGRVPCPGCSGSPTRYIMRSSWPRT